MYRCEHVLIWSLKKQKIAEPLLNLVSISKWRFPLAAVWLHDTGPCWHTGLYSEGKKRNVHAIVTTFPELVLCFGSSYMLFCMMGFTNFLLLKEAVPLLAACYYNFSFAGSVLVWLFRKSTLLRKLTKPILLLGWLFVGLLSWARLIRGWDKSQTVEKHWWGLCYWKRSSCMGKDRRVAHFSSSLPTLGSVAHPVLWNLVLVSESPYVILLWIWWPQPWLICSSSEVCSKQGILSVSAVLQPQSILCLQTDEAPASVSKGVQGWGVVVLLWRNMKTAKRDCCKCVLVLTCLQKIKAL